MRPGMGDGVARLGRVDEPALAVLLERDVVSNLFLVAYLAAHPAERSWWYGVGEPVRAAVLVMPGRLAVPYAPDPADAAALGAHLRVQHAPSMVVGERAASDALWRRWSGDTVPHRRHDQRLYVLERGLLAARPDPTGFRVARLEDWPEVARGAAEMELEDIGVDPRRNGTQQHEAVVQERLRIGRTYVIDEHRALVFQVNVGTAHPSGAQIGGTWVPPRYRGAGRAKAGIAATCRRVLRDHPRVTLHVNEANLPAVRVYEATGFARATAFRLIVP